MKHKIKCEKCGQTFKTWREFARHHIRYVEDNKTNKTNVTQFIHEKDVEIARLKENIKEYLRYQIGLEKENEKMRKKLEEK